VDRAPLSGYTYENDRKDLLAQDNADSFVGDPANPYSGAMPFRPYAPRTYGAKGLGLEESRENLVDNAEPLGGEGLPRKRDLRGYEGGYGGVGR
jgi:hypothetical protein